MPASCVVVRFTWASLAKLCAALMEHAERLDSLLEPSWHGAAAVHGQMYALVDTLIQHGDTKNALALFPLLRGQR
jgi:hypothetical protein